MGLSHGKQTVFKLDNLAGALQDISPFFRSADGLPGAAERPETSQFGDNLRYQNLGRRDGGPISLGGLFKPAATAVHGKGAVVLADQYSLTGRARTLSVQRTVELQQTEQFGDDWIYREGLGRHGGSGSLGGLYNGAAGEIDAILWALHGSGTPGVFSAFYAGGSIGTLVDLFQAAITRHGVRSPHDNMAEISADFNTDERVDLGISLHALSAEGSAAPPVNFTSVDESAATTSGGVGHLHVTAFTGTNITVKIQHSVDDAVWVDLISFTAAAGATKERLEVAGTVNRYVRAIISAGTWTSATFAVAFSRRGYTYGTAGTFRHLAGLAGAAASSSFEYGPEGSTAGKTKYSGEARLASLGVEVSHADLINFSASLAVSGPVAKATF